MSAIGGLIGWVLPAFLVLLIARAVLDWVAVLANGPYWVRRVRMVVYRLTEPVLEPVRRRMRPVRAGGFAIDLAFTVVFLAVVVLRSIAFRLVAAIPAPLAAG